MIKHRLAAAALAAGLFGEQLHGSDILAHGKQPPTAPDHAPERENRRESEIFRFRMTSRMTGRGFEA